MTTSQDMREHFRTLSPGKLTGLRGITDAAGRFKVLALDQSNSFKKAIKAMKQRTGQPAEAASEEILATKLEMVSTLAPSATAVLLDVNYGLRQSLNTGALPKGIGLIGRLEASRDAGLPGEVEPGWSVAAIKRMGCSAVKLLVYLDVEDNTATKAQMDFVKRTRDECGTEDILLMVEELSYPRAGEDKKSPAYVARRPKNIVEACRLLGPHCDVLKLEFPADLRSESASAVDQKLRELNDAAIRPWVLLSAGEKFDLFVQQVELAMKAGSSGTMAGRAIFNEYFDQDTIAARHQFLETTGLDRMKKLSDLVERHAIPWMKRTAVTPKELAAAVAPDWYRAGQNAAVPAAETHGAY